MTAVALYNRDLLRLAASLEAMAPLTPPSGHAEMRSPTCGSRVSLSVRRTGDGRIDALSADVASCALGQASAAILLREARGLDQASIEAARHAMENYLLGADTPPPFTDAGLFGPARDYPARHPAIMLPYDALLVALADEEHSA